MDEERVSVNRKKQCWATFAPRAYANDPTDVHVNPSQNKYVDFHVLRMMGTSAVTTGI
jgi:hypothetical protein